MRCKEVLEVSPSWYSVATGQTDMLQRKHNTHPGGYSVTCQKIATLANSRHWCTYPEAMSQVSHAGEDSEEDIADIRLERCLLSPLRLHAGHALLYVRIRRKSPQVTALVMTPSSEEDLVSGTAS